MKKIWYCLLGALLVATAAADAPLPLSDFPQSTLQIATPDARLHRFNIWIAEDDVHREQGLMFIKKLPENAGMLFIYSAPQRIGIWMKNTYIPLDIVFISADGRIANIVPDAKPLSEDTMESKNVVAVLELNGGTAARLNIRKGAVVMHPFFGNAMRTNGD
jgi:uncharacterized protein